MELKWNWSGEELGQGGTGTERMMMYGGKTEDIDCG